MWLILILHVAVVLWQTALFPNFRSPDERQHVDLIVMVERGAAWPWPDPGTLHLSQGSGAGGFTKSNRIDGPLHLADRPLPPRPDRLSFDAAGGTAPARGQQPNQLIQHPPLYYVAGAFVLAAVPDGIPFDLTYLLLRWGNVLLTAALPLVLWAVARRLRLPDPIPIAAALVPLAIPELTHNESSVNNDNLLILLFAVLTLLVARVLTGDSSRRTALAIGGVGSLALLTKGFALLVPVWVLIAYAGRRFWSSLGLALLAMLPGLAWWIHNRIAYGSLQPHGRFTGVPDLTPQYAFGDGGPGWVLRLLERMNTLFFVHDQTGQRLHTLPWKLAVAAALLVAAGVVVTLLLRAIPRAAALVLLVPVVGLLAIVAKGSYEQFAANHTFAGMQGRYLYGGLVGLAVVAVAALAKLPARWRRAGPLAVLLFALVIQAGYLIYTFNLFWRPADGSVGRGVRAIVDWYALPPAVLGLVVVVLLASLAATLVMTGWLAFQPASPVGLAPAGAASEAGALTGSASVEVASAPVGRAESAAGAFSALGGVAEPDLPSAEAANPGSAQARPGQVERVPAALAQAGSTQARQVETGRDQSDLA